MDFFSQYFSSMHENENEGKKITMEERRGQKHGDYDCVPASSPSNRVAFLPAAANTRISLAAFCIFCC